MKKELILNLLNLSNNYNLVDVKEEDSIYNLRRGSFREVSSFIGIHTRTLKRYINKFMKKSIPWEYFNTPFR